MKSLTKIVINDQKTVKSVEEEAAAEISLRLIESVGLKNANDKENWNCFLFRYLYNATQRKYKDVSVFEEDSKGHI